MNICPSCGTTTDDPSRLWTCTCCGTSACHGCMAQYPGTTACADCRGKIQTAARQQAEEQIPEPGQARENRVTSLFEIAWWTHRQQHATGG